MLSSNAAVVLASRLRLFCVAEYVPFAAASIISDDKINEILPLLQRQKIAVDRITKATNTALIRMQDTHFDAHHFFLVLDLISICAP